jgi:hypothetical protein
MTPPVITTAASCKDPGRHVVRRTDYITYINELLDPRYQLDTYSLGKALELYAAQAKGAQITIKAASRTKYLLQEVVDPLTTWILGRANYIPTWRAMAVAKAKRAAAAYKPAKTRGKVELAEPMPTPVVSTEAAQEVNRILNGAPSKVASMFAEAVMKAPSAKPVLRLGAVNYIALYEDPNV